jgi:hypothetical protein
MIVEVELNAFQDGKIRPVEIPSEAIHLPTMELLEEVFRLGQNMFQPVEGCCSVSVGDVIRFGDERWEVDMFGFKRLPDECEDYEMDDIVDEIQDGMEQMKELKNEILEGGF